MTASTSFIARLSARSVATCAMPYLAATSLVGSILLPTNETTSTPSMFLMPSRCLMPNAPAPASATLVGPVTSIILQDEVSYGRVAGWHMVEPMPHGGRLAAIHVVHCAARDQPHHQFDPFTACLADVVNVRHERQALGVRDQAVEECGIELFVDEPGAGTLQLMAHPASTPDLNVERFVVALDCLADRLAQHVTTSAGGCRVLHHIYGKRDYWTRPCLRLAAHQAQRHRQSVVDIHLVYDGQIEVVLDHGLRDVRGEFRMTDDLGHGTRAPTLVGRHELAPGSEC